jgi:hypothetical protein
MLRICVHGQINELNGCVVRRAEARLERVDAGYGGIKIWRGVMCEDVGDQRESAGAMVDNDEVADKIESLSGNGHLGGWHAGKPLELTHRIPADESYESAGEGGDVCVTRTAPALSQCSKGVEAELGHRSAERHIGSE